MTLHRIRSWRLVPGVLSGALLALAGCSSDPASPPQGVGGVGSGGSSGAAGQPASSGSSGTSGSSQGGAGTGGALGGSAGSSGMGGTTAGGAGSSGQGGGGPTVKAGCANNAYAICLDFETPLDKSVWTQGSDAAISSADKAHGEKSYHAYKNAPVLTTAQFGSITNVMWGRFYLRMTPGAPGGHGNIVGAYQGGDWYELGWQFNGLMGVWHYGNGERPLRSHPDIVDKWYCVELLFDGTKTEMPKWWIDGQEAEYYMPEPNAQLPKVISQFDKLTVGFTTYAGLGLAKEPYGNNDPPVLEDMWLDDIAFDTKRIGCITE